MSRVPVPMRQRASPVPGRTSHFLAATVELVSMVPARMWRGEAGPRADVGGTERRTSGQSLWNGWMFPGGFISCHNQTPLIHTEPRMRARSSVHRLANLRPTSVSFRRHREAPREGTALSTSAGRLGNRTDRARGHSSVWHWPTHLGQRRVAIQVCRRVHDGHSRVRDEEKEKRLQRFRRHRCHYWYHRCKY